MLRILLFLSLIVALCINCSKSVSADKYLEENKKDLAFRTRSFDRAGFRINVMYQPWESFAAREINALKETDIKQRDIVKKYNKSLYFVLSIETLGSENISGLLLQDGVGGYSKNLKENTFSRNKDIFICKESDTLRLQNYQYERNWGMNNFDIFVLMFKKEYKDSKLKNYNLLIRNLHPNIGTIDIPLKDIIRKTCKLKVEE